MSDKIFCIECKYLFEEKRLNFDPDFSMCQHPENLTYIETWRERIPRQIVLPKFLNKNNDCKYFEKKELNPPKSGSGVTKKIKEEK